ncbi:MAG: twin-arginine translocase subunit TatB, partial [Acetobacter papayae]
VGAVALLVIGTKDLPVALRGLAGFVKKARRMAGEFQSHFDEMVRDADLGEVRDQVRDLKNLNVRGRIIKALDDDGGLSRAVERPSTLTDYALPPSPRALDRRGPPTLSRSAIEPAAWPTVSEDVVDMHEQTVSDETVEAAPPELPPGIVRRILNEQPRLLPPAILPPVRVLHGRHVVRPTPLGGTVGGGQVAQPSSSVGQQA